MSNNNFMNFFEGKQFFLSSVDLNIFAARYLSNVLKRIILLAMFLVP